MWVETLIGTILTVSVAGMLWRRRVRMNRQPMWQPRHSHAHLFELRQLIPPASVKTVGNLLTIGLPLGHSRAGKKCMQELRKLWDQADYLGAIQLLEEQLQQVPSGDAIESSRFLVDLAAAAKIMQINEALPMLLEQFDRVCTELKPEYAAELVGFVAFAEYLQYPTRNECRYAMRVLKIVMESVRRNRLPMSMYADAYFGDAIRRLCEHCPESVDPLVIQLFVEARRHARRVFHQHATFRDDPARRQHVRWQIAYLRDSESLMAEYLHDISQELPFALEEAAPENRWDILECCLLLRVDVGLPIIQLWGELNFQQQLKAIEVLSWSKDAEIRTHLVQLASRAVQQGSPEEQLACAAMKSLQNYPCEPVERLQIHFLDNGSNEARVAALESMGWHEPILRIDTLSRLNHLKQHKNPRVRKAALAACARLGEIAALNILRESLHQPAAIAIDAIRMIANEGISWLWPELDELTESDDMDVQMEAWEAVERLREQFLPLAID